MSDIRIERHGPVAVVVFDRPQALNAWTGAMRREIVEASRSLASSTEVGAVVFTGAGERAFGAGQDLKEGAAPDPAEIDGWIEGWREFFGVVRTFPKPTVSAVNGVAAGSALQFALLTDLRIGHAGVRMGQPEIKAGIASSTGPWILHEMVGPLRAADLVLTGRMALAEECLALGLLSRIVARDQVVAEAIRIAAELAGLPAVAVRLTKARLARLTSEGFEACFPIWREILKEASGASDAAARP